MTILNIHNKQEIRMRFINLIQALIKKSYRFLIMIMALSFVFVIPQDGNSRDFRNDSSKKLSVLSVSPRGKTRYPGQYSSVRVVFNQPVVALGKLGNNMKTGPIKFYPSVPGKYKWLGTRTLAFYPEKKFTENTRIRAVLDSGIKAVNGSRLEQKYMWTFDTQRPKLKRSKPYNNSKWIKGDEKVFLYFNMPVNLYKAKKYIQLNENKNTKRFALRYIKKDELTKWQRKKFDVRTVLVVVPYKNFRKNSNVGVIVLSGLPGVKGNLGTDGARIVRFQTYKDFKYTGKNQQSILPLNYGGCDTLSLKFTNPVVYKELFKHMHFKPEIKMKNVSYRNYNWHRNTFCLTLNYKCETDYELVIDKKLTDKFGQKLGKDIKVNFHVGSFRPSFSMPSGLGIIESSQGRNIPVTVMNPENMKTLSRQLTKDEIIPALLHKKYFYIPYNIKSMYGEIDKFGKKYSLNRTEDFKPQYKKNKYAVTPLNLTSLLGNKNYGILDLQMQGPNQYSQPKTRKINSLVQVTDLGVTGKFAAESNYIFVTDLQNGKPVKDAKVEIRSDFNKVLWKGKTGKQGTVKTPGWVKLGLKSYSYSPVRQWVIVEKDGDTAFINNEWGTGISPWSFGVSYQNNPLYPFYNGTVRTERGIYKPGEKVHFKAVLREKKDGEWTIPKIRTLKYRIKDTRGRIIKKGKTRMTSFGTFSFDHKLKESDPTGYYSVQLYKEEPKQRKYSYRNRNRKPQERKGKIFISGSFRVEVFQPLQFDVTVRADEKNYFLGDKANFSVTGWYMFDAPMTDRKVTATVNARETFYYPPGNPGFKFSKMRWIDDKYYYPKTGRLYSGSAKLGKNGVAVFPVKLKLGTDIHSMNVSTEATVYGENQERVSGRKTILVHGSSFYIGLKRSKYFVEKGNKAEFEVISVNPDGKRREDDKIKVRVYRRYWESVKKAGVGGRYSWESRKIDLLIKEKTVESDEDGKTISFVPEKTGMYFVRATSKDLKGRSASADEYIYAVGGGYAPWLMTDDDRIELVPDKSAYSPGQTARILVKSPYDECTALVTVEKEFVLYSRIMHLKGSASVIDIPIKSEFLPNAYVGVSLIKGRIKQFNPKESKKDPGKPSFKIGYVAINVSPEERHLKVDIKKSHAVRSPGDPMEVSFQVKNSKGKGVKSECMVSVCDEGVLELIGYKTPDYFKNFYGLRPLGVMTSDTRLHIIGQRNYGEKGENRGGGGGKAMRMKGAGMDMDLFSFRKNFLSTAFYNAAVVTDKNGRAKVNFNLPDNLTRFRIMVSAVAGSGYFGAGEDRVVVKKYLMLRSTLPQFAVTGDTFSAGCVVYNYSDSDSEIKVKIKAENADVKGDAVKTVFVKKDGSADVRFNLTCETPGDAKIKIAAVAGKHTDAIERTFKVKIPRLVESVALFESFDRDRAYQNIKIPGENEIFKGSGNLEVTFSSSAFSGLKNGIDYLLEYPYGCLEQRISRALPVVLSKNLILGMDLTKYTEKELDGPVNEVLQKIASFQSGNGGFSYWTSRRWVSPWLSAYTCYFMLKAEKQGYKIDRNVLNKGLQYLAKYTRKNIAQSNLPYNVYCHMSSRAFAAYVLALGGKADRSVINRLNSRFEEMPIYARANLLKAMYHAGYKKKYLNRARQSLFNSIKIASTTAHYEDHGMPKLYWIHSSSVRATSAVLQAFIETKTYNPLNDKVVNWLVLTRKHKGRFENTQDNVYAFHAMADYFGVYEKVKPDFTAKMAVEGKELLKHVFKGRKGAAFRKKLSFDKFKPGKEIRADILREGKGRLYYGIRMNYAPKELLKSRDMGFKVEKWFETLDGKRVNGDEFKSGKEYVAVVKINTNQERHFVMMDDPVPAGFRVLNMSFKTQGQEKYKKIRNTSGWWGSFSHYEQYDDRVLAFGDSLRRGEHVYRYVVRAVTPGKFLLPPTKVEEMYTPDVFGYYGQRYVKIK